MLHQMFAVSNSRGLTTALLDSERPASFYLQNSGINNLKVLTSGPVPPNPAELLNSQRMSQIIAELKEESDTVIFDTPPVLSVADASIIAPRVDGCVLIIQAGKTRQAALEQAVSTLSKTNGHLLGVVLNQVAMGRSAYYYYRQHEYGPPEERRLASRLPGWLSVLVRRS
jgi:capsular exopolysaccharide synthesis family protein